MYRRDAAARIAVPRPSFMEGSASHLSVQKLMWQLGAVHRLYEACSPTQGALSSHTQVSTAARTSLSVLLRVILCYFPTALLPRESPDP